MALESENALLSASSGLKKKKVEEDVDKKEDEAAGWREARNMLQPKKRGAPKRGGKKKGTKEEGDGDDSHRCGHKVPTTSHTGSGRKAPPRIPDPEGKRNDAASSTGSMLDVEMSLDADGSEMAPIELLSSDDDEGPNENVGP
jgi:hypothetical protein